ncbi:MAG TPA: hypothetical protein VN711_01205 [Candidatus Saccharimonadales bacterium]|nr:hypothetical protein [Candidatus Saccharimonadales bacterium]
MVGEVIQAVGGMVTNTMPVMAVETVAPVIAVNPTPVMDVMAPVVPEAIGINTMVEGLVAASPLLEMAPESPLDIVSDVEAALQLDGGHSALELLAQGEPVENLSEQPTLESLAKDLQALAPENLNELLQHVEGLDVPEEMMQDPEFLAAFAKEFGKSLQAEQNGKNGEGNSLTDQMTSLMRDGVKHALTQKTKTELPKDKDLEKLKKEAAKKAALMAIQQLMNSWRVSVMKDKRLSQQAQMVAYKKVGLVEQRLMTTELMRWDGVSLMKLITLATVWMKEMQEDSLPQPKG